MNQATMHHVINITSAALYEDLLFLARFGYFDLAWPVRGRQYCPAEWCCLSCELVAWYPSASDREQCDSPPNS